jgi:hypothetical protein
MKRSSIPAQRHEKLRKLKPELKWQTGEYTRYPTFHFILPYPFLLLCRLTNTTPEQILYDFMENLSCSASNREGRDEAKQQLISYFITHRYGNEFYTDEELQQIFKEMDAVGLLFPKRSGTKLLDKYSAWRKKHQNQWFRNWYHKPRRRL